MNIPGEPINSRDGDSASTPPRPDPWTTNTALQGLRESHEVRIICLAPDVCLTPRGSAVVPVPYQIVDYGDHDHAYTSSVRFTGMKAMVLRSNTTHVHGDEPGVAKGVKSQTVGDVTEPIEHAPHVRAEKSHIIRHLDKFWMNRRNTVGEAHYVVKTDLHTAPKDDDPIPGSMRNISVKSAAASVAPAPAPTPLPRPAPLPRPPGDNVIRPDPPQWRTPLPEPPALPEVPPEVGAAGRFARFGPWALAIGLALWPSKTAMPWDDELPADNVERQIFEQAKRLKKAGVSDDEVSAWFNSERSAHREARRKQEESDPKPSAQPRPNARVDEDQNKKCPWTTICFNPKTTNYDPKEFDRQLSDQETALDKFTPNEWENNRDAVVAAGSTDPFRNSPAARQAYNVAYSGLGAAQERYPGQPLAALHSLDIIAGGYADRFSGLGPARENSIIGAQWAQANGVYGRDRLARLHALAEALKANKCPHMTARLRRCTLTNSPAGRGIS